MVENTILFSFSRDHEHWVAAASPFQNDGPPRQGKGVVALQSLRLPRQRMVTVSDHLWEIQTGPNEKATMLAILNAAQEMAWREKATSTEQRAARSQGTEETSTASWRDNNSGVFEASAK